MTDAALLPPTARASTLVADTLANPTAGLPPETTKFEEAPYKSKLELVGVGQQIGVSTNSQFGTYVSGGIALQFSDLLGNHLLGTGFSVDGGVKDIAASITYLNRTSRWNWGVFGERVPLLSGTVRQGYGVVQGQPVFVEESDLLRQTYLQAGALTAYPFSRSTRVEFSAAARNIGFDREIKTRYYDSFNGEFLGEETTELPTDPSIRLFDVSAAAVRDTSVFGATSPILGQRLRLEYAPTFGDLRMNNFTADLRQVLHARAAGHAGRTVAARGPVRRRLGGPAAAADVPRLLDARPWLRPEFLPGERMHADAGRKLSRVRSSLREPPARRAVRGARAREGSLQRQARLRSGAGRALRLLRRRHGVVKGRQHAALGARAE